MNFYSPSAQTGSKPPLSP